MHDLTFAIIFPGVRNGSEMIRFTRNATQLKYIIEKDTVHDMMMIVLHTLRRTYGDMVDRNLRTGESLRTLVQVLRRMKTTCGSNGTGFWW